MSMKVTLEEFLNAEKKPALSPENIAFKTTLDFEAEVFKKLHEKNLSQKDLARLLDVSPTAVSKMLTKGANITIKTMAKIAHALDCVLAPIKLKNASEYSYFDIDDPETVSASVELSDKHNPPKRATTNIAQIETKGIRYLGTAYLQNSNSSHNEVKIGGLAA